MWVLCTGSCTCSVWDVWGWVCGGGGGGVWGVGVIQELLYPMQIQSSHVLDPSLIRDQGTVHVHIYTVCDYVHGCNMQLHTCTCTCYICTCSASIHVHL